MGQIVIGLARAEACIVKVESHSDVPDVAFRMRKVKPAIIMIHTVLVLCGTVRKI